MSWSSADQRLSSVLTDLGVPATDAHRLPSSEKRFLDGAHYRIEIPSTEGPEGLEMVLQEAQQLEVPVHRVSQGSGVFMMTNKELNQYAATAAMAGIEACLFTRPTAGWAASATTLAPSGGTLVAAARGMDQLLGCADDILRAADHGIRSMLISDIGVLRLFSEMRRQAVLPATMQAKVSVMLAVANPLSAKVLVELGASTLNLPTDLDLAQISAIRRSVDVPLDLYVEAPPDMGGFVRLTEIPEIVRVAAPVYLKFGIRNGPDVYPMGEHFRQTALAMSRERVRRARLGIELLQRSGVQAVTSAAGAAGLAVPETEATDVATESVSEVRPSSTL